MKLTEKQIDIVLAYVRNEMTEEAFLDFKQNTTNQKALEEEVLFQKSILSAVKLNEVNNAIDQAKTENILDNKSEHPKFEAIHRNMNQARAENENKKRQIRRWVITGVAATFLLFVGTFGFRTYLDNQLENSLNSIVNNIDIDGMAQKIDGIKSVSGRSMFINSKLKAAQTAYQNKDWDSVLSIFNQLEDQSKYQTAGMDYCKSVILFNKKEYAKSIQGLERIDLNTTASACEIHYFLTLSYLKINKKQAAEKQFNLLSKNTENCDQQLVSQLNKHFLL